MLEPDISLEEIALAVKNLQKQETPGPDGLSVEFFKQSQEKLCPILSEGFNNAFEGTMLPPTFYHGHTKLIAKGESADVKRYNGGYQPASLCNIRYNIVAGLQL